ncbi:MAG: hypothetical protein HN368_06235, partial [Spirochaetales bacterium]|nr:hypothetical protein [Spirochaetales bacterium]
RIDEPNGRETFGYAVPAHCFTCSKELRDVRAVATIGAPADPAHVEGLFTGEVKSIEEEGQAMVSIGGRPFTIQRSFLEDIRDHPPEQWLAELKSDVMVLHSPVDNIVGIENAERIFKTIKHPKSFVSLREADHLFSRAEDAAYAGRIIGAWASSILAEKSQYRGKYLWISLRAGFLSWFSFFPVYLPDSLR